MPGDGLVWRVTYRLAAACWLALASGRAAGEDGPGCAEAVAEARALLAEGDDVRALEVSEAAARRYPEDVAVQLVLGLSALRLGRWEQAAAAYHAALALNEESFIARIGASDALSGLGRWRVAEGAVSPWRGAALPPRAEAERLLRVGRARLGARRLEGAEEAYAAAGALARAASKARGDGRGGEAEAASRAADRLEAEARLGIAWVALARGDAATARSGFEALAQAAGADVRASAAEGLMAVGPPDGLGGGVAAFGQADRANHALGLLGGADARVSDAFRFGLRYRHLSGPVSGSPRAPRFAQHEAWAFAGWWTPGLSLTVHGAAVNVDARRQTGGAVAIATREAGAAGGVSLRVRAGLDWLASAGFSATTAEAVAQAELGARLVLGPAASVSLSARGQVAEGGPWLAGRAALRVGSGDVLLEGSGLLGRQRRPVELDATALYCTLGHLDGRASALAGVRLGGRWWLMAGYDWEAWRDPDGAARGQHRAGLGLWVLP